MNSNDRKTELSAAFERAERWVNEARRNSPMNGFGRGYEMGEEMLKRFMPEWFKRWMEVSKWHPVGLLQGEDGWWIYVKAFGLTQEAWWKQIEDAE